MRSGEAFEGAYVHWDAQWRNQKARLAWGDPEPWVTQVVYRVRAQGGRRALDIGCGIGRHTQVLAQAGFEAHGVDRSETGLAHARELAAAKGLEMRLRTADFRDLPFESAGFDYVLAWNVVYHGTEDDLRSALSEIRRVLRRGGLYQATMLSKRNTEFSKGVEMAPNAYVQPDAEDDKVHPHLYCDHRDIARLHADWRILTAVDSTQGGRGSHHWNLLLERPG
ncbi:class I SAM-dependent methyltransferase [Actinomadura rubrisoli]|uniref:Class I SAM-dependent methyltransferase n=1 Tax=Actinomadura rubrisoli TaxID=2530368 RepID=A0A4R5BHR9_9ACTN|nr:class I SAM-dependent methyltransferase [Actinomadura rubrisoli]TDD85029.1 class I SAM-dependent methyltransferase [Actinomadura rubrisoli]